MLIFDGHLDIAYNALSHERDPLLPVQTIRQRESEGVLDAGGGVDDGRGLCTSSLHEMREAGIAVALTTVLARSKSWVKPGRAKARLSGDWPTPEMAYAIAQSHLAYYKLLETQGEIRILKTASELADHWSAWEKCDRDHRPPVGIILTMECADPIVEPEQVHEWYQQGLRTLLMTHFGQGRYAAGNPSEDSNNIHDVDGPVTPLGIRLLDELSKLRIPIDLTHTSDTSFFDIVNRYEGPLYSTHTNCRAISDQQRQFSDDMIRAILKRGGVLGMCMAINMIRLDLIEGPPWTPMRHGVELHHLVDHIDHICQMAGNTSQVALGSDTDGGFGAECCPHGFDTHRDLHKVAGLLAKRGYTDADIAGLMHQNWLRFFGATLP